MPIETTPDREALGRRGGGDESHDGLVVAQRFAAPIRRMNEKRRCSTLFHLLVPGGKWQTRIESPCSSAQCCSSTFPQPQTVTVAAAAIRGDGQELRGRRIPAAGPRRATTRESTATATAVSWSVPTFTKPG